MRHPTKIELQPIEDVLKEGNKKHGELSVARRRLTRAINSGAPVAVVKKLERDVANLMEQRNDAWNRAISMTLFSFNFMDFPTWPQGTIQTDSPFFQGTYDFAPVAADNDGRIMISPAGVAYKRSPVQPSPELKNTVASATVDEDGVASMFPLAFTSTEKLFFDLVHEWFHFDDMTNPNARSITIAESEINARRVVIHFSQYYPWKSAAEQKAFTDKITAEIALFEVTRAAEEPLKQAGTLPRKRFVNVETVERPDLQVDLDPIREEAARVKREAEAHMFERHLDSLQTLARRQCSGSPPTQADFDKLVYRLDVSLYESAAGRAGTAIGCLDETYASYLAALAAGQRLLARPDEEAARRARHLTELQDMAARMCQGRTYLEIELDSIPYVPDRDFYARASSRFAQDMDHEPDCAEDRYAFMLTKLAQNGRLQPSMFRFPTAEPVKENAPPVAPKPLDPADLPQAPKPRVPIDGERNLLSLVSAACQKPWEFKSMSFGDLSWFPQPGVPLGPQGKRELTECEKALWSFVLDLNDKGARLDLDALAQRASGYQSRPPARPDGPYNHCIDPGNTCIPGLGR